MLSVRSFFVTLCLVLWCKMLYWSLSWDICSDRKSVVHAIVVKVVIFTHNLVVFCLQIFKTSNFKHKTLRTAWLQLVTVEYVVVISCLINRMCMRVIADKNCSRISLPLSTVYWLCFILSCKLTFDKHFLLRWNSCPDDSMKHGGNF